MKCFNAFTGETITFPNTATLHSLRSPAKYWVISNTQLKRDLRPRTLKDVYRENRALRGVEQSYVPKHTAHGALRAASWAHRATMGRGTFGGLGITPGGRTVSIEAEYLADCAARGHIPHPASIDPDHPQNCHRETLPKRDYGFGLAIPELKEAA